MFGNNNNNGDDSNPGTDPFANQTPTNNDGGGMGLPSPDPAAQNNHDDTNQNHSDLDALAADTNDSSNAPAPETTSTNDDLLTMNDDLIGLKQQALQQLSPLVGHLEQSPEEKFRTTMMMIQASDDQSLIRQAYDAAQQISDEKAKAQALLDIVNEINYFTQQKDD